jgi:mannitol 2-dehydrogenase
VVDRLKEPLMAAAARQRAEPLAFIADRDVFGDLIDNKTFVTAYTRTLNDLHGGGARAALESLRSRS